MPIISLHEIHETFTNALIKRGMASERAQKLAAGFVEMANEGVYSHGINRFPVFISAVDKGSVDLKAEPECVNSMGALEQWDCHFGPGVLNGLVCSERAMELARTYGVGMVAMRNSNHWMRGGSYALKMAREGFAAIAATNAIATMPPWGGKTPRLGNNPLIMAISGDPPVLVDCSMSQFSYGQIENHKLAGKPLPVGGGFDDQGELTTDPNIIWENHRALPIGFWKGSSLSLILDMMLTAIAGGVSSARMSSEGKGESGVCQFLIAIDVSRTMNQEQFASEMQFIRDYVLTSEPAEQGEIRIAGESIQRYLDKHHAQGGIEIHPDIWQRILEL